MATTISMISQTNSTVAASTAQTASTAGSAFAALLATAGTGDAVLGSGSSNAAAAPAVSSSTTAILAAAAQDDPVYDIASGTWSNIPPGLTEEDMNSPHNAVALNGMLQAWWDAGSDPETLPQPVADAMEAGTLRTNVVHQAPEWMRVVVQGSTNMLRTPEGEPVNIAYDTLPEALLRTPFMDLEDQWQAKLTGRAANAGEQWQAWQDQYVQLMSANADLMGPGEPWANLKGSSVSPINSPSAFLKTIEIFGVHGYGGGTNGPNDLVQFNEATGEVWLDPQRVMSQTNNAALAPVIAELQQAGITGPVTVGFVPSRAMGAEFAAQYEAAKTADDAFRQRWADYRSGAMTLDEMAAFDQEMQAVIGGGAPAYEVAEATEATEPAELTPTYATMPKSRFDVLLEGGREAVEAMPKAVWEERPWLKTYMERAHNVFGNWERSVESGATPAIDHPVLGAVPVQVARDFETWIVSNFKKIDFGDDTVGRAFVADVRSTYAHYIADKMDNPGVQRPYLVDAEGNLSWPPPTETGAGATESDSATTASTTTASTTAAPTSASSTATSPATSPAATSSTASESTAATVDATTATTTESTTAQSQTASTSGGSTQPASAASETEPQSAIEALLASLSGASEATSASLAKTLPAASSSSSAYADSQSGQTASGGGETLQSTFLAHLASYQSMLEGTAQALRAYSQLQLLAQSEHQSSV